MKQVVNYIFDVDGTVTPSRSRIDPEFAEWFADFCSRELVYFVTGSDRDKTIEQIGEEIYNRAMRVYQCAGNDVWAQSNNIRTNDWNGTSQLNNDLHILLNQSKFYGRGGHHIDIRPGLVNFSVPGRLATKEQRQAYVEWDTEHSERQAFARVLKSKHPDLSISVAGETGIDIYPKGKDKSQILEDFNQDDIIYFYGDKCEAGGNDFEIARAIKQLNNGSKVYNVRGWEETWQLISSVD